MTKENLREVIPTKEKHVIAGTPLVIPGVIPGVNPSVLKNILGLGTILMAAKKLAEPKTEAKSEPKTESNPSPKKPKKPWKQKLKDAYTKAAVTTFTTSLVGGIGYGGYKGVSNAINNWKQSIIDEAINTYEQRKKTESTKPVEVKSENKPTKDPLDTEIDMWMKSLK